MFLGAGPTEIVVILILAFIIFGPSRLPEIAKTLAKAMHEFKKATTGLQTAVQKDFIEPINNGLVKPVVNNINGEDEEEVKGDSVVGSK